MHARFAGVPFSGSKTSGQILQLDPGLGPGLSPGSGPGLISVSNPAAAVNNEARQTLCRASLFLLTTGY